MKRSKVPHSVLQNVKLQNHRPIYLDYWHLQGALHCSQGKWLR